MFGQPSNSSFGFNTSSQSGPFGQSAFSKSVSNTNFGTSTPPVFGNNSSLFNAKTVGTNPSLFGSSTSTSTFGTSTSSQSFGGFSNANAGTLFGTQQNANNNLFGSSSSPSTFGQTSKPASFGFGQPSNSSIFGQTQQQNTQQALPFGQIVSTNTGGLFGSSSGFGASTSTNNISGTVVKFNPVTGSDNIMKNGVTQTISTRHHCITCMKEYESKSLEELRLEDYSAGRKGIIQGQSSSLFGSTSQGVPFGSGVTNSGNTTSGFGGLTAGFGASNATNLFSKSVPGFCAPVTTSSTFAFNTPSSNLFSTQTKPFGSTSSTPLFSSSGTTVTPGNVFGSSNTQTSGFGTNFNTGQSTQNISLFPPNKTTFSVPSSSTNSFVFGQPSTSNSNTLFNLKPGETGFNTGFGGNSQATFQPSNTGFGSAPNTNASLFNNSFKPAIPSSGFTFGNASSTPSAATGSPAASIFNATTKPNIFSHPSTSTFNTAASFGSVPSFGSVSTTIPLLGSSLFGSGISASSHQNSSGIIPVHQQILALVSTPFGDSPLLKNLLPASGKSEEFLKPCNSLSKGNSNSHHKIFSRDKTTMNKPKIMTPVPLSKKNLFDGLEEESPLVEAFQPRLHAKRLVLKPKLVVTNIIDEINSAEQCNLSSAETDYADPEKENDLQNNDQQLNSGQSTSWLKSNIPRINTNLNEKYQANSSNCSKSVNSSSMVENLNNTVEEFQSRGSSQICTLSNTKKDLIERRDFEIPIEEHSTNSELEDSPLPSNPFQMTAQQKQSYNSNIKTNIQLQRHGYYTIPPLNKLDEYVTDKTCFVPHFTIGRHGYGNVYFADSFDVYGLNLDEIVHFRHKEVIIYPDDHTKPPVGEGLNRKAQVTLDRVWPHDKCSHEPITDPKRLIEMDYEGKLRRVSAKHDTRFLEYRPETGSWVFKVDHFSKYGLSDSDDEEAVVNEKSKKEIMKATEIQKFSESLVDKKLFTKKTCFVHSFYSTEDYDEEESNKLETQQKKNDSGKILSTNTIQSSSAVNAHLAGTKSHTLQLMKASFFELGNLSFPEEYFQNDESIDQRHLSFVEAGTGLQQKKTRNSLDELAPLSSVNLLRNQSAYTNKSICDVEVLRNFSKLVKNSTLEFQPKVFNSEYQYSTDLEIFDSNECYLKYVADIGLQKKKQYKLKWSPKLTLLSCNNNTGHGVSNSVSFVKIKDCFCSDFKYFIELSRRVTYEFETEIIKKFKDSVEQHLNVQLKYLHIEVTNSSPSISPISVPSNKDAIHEHAVLSAEKNYLSNKDLSTIYFQNVWHLIESLWGTLVVTFFDSHIHEIEVLRKEALTKWFQQITAAIIKGGIQATEPKDQKIFLLLTANKVEEACNIALESGDYCLALLLSQLDGSSMVRELIEHQIELWQDAEADDYFSLSRLKLIMLIAGVKKLSKKSETVNVCEDLDWKRAFAVHLWYLAPSTASITDVLDVYDSSITADKSHLIPRPEYFNNDSKTAMYTARAPIDLCYHLIKLYCSRSYPIEVLLNPESYTGNMFDYRMSYMLHQTLIGLGYTHVPDHVTTIVYSSFAAQLETYDLWNWSIFIVLNHKNCHERKRAVMDLLFRHVELDNTSDYEEKENFLIKSLKISPKWINEAKAVKASTIKRYEEAAWYYIAAEKWNEAHEIIIRHIAIDAIINGDHEYLKTLLRLFISTDCYTSVSGWAYQGQLILDYITIITEINELLKNKSNLDVMYSLELLRPQLISLCTNIKMFPSNSSKNRLCQAEMSKRTLQLAKGLLMSSSEEDKSNFFIQFVSQLPLPEDYAQQELRSVINGFV